MDDLLSLPVVNSASVVKGIRQLHHKIRFTSWASQALEVESDQYSTLLVTVLLNKVPRELWLIIGRKFNSDSRNLDELLKCF